MLKHDKKLFKSKEVVKPDGFSCVKERNMIRRKKVRISTSMSFEIHVVAYKYWQKK